ncbi:MAG: FemAB family PEP-CTERM system-associated protein [Planctomycetaceae bacterium]|nr:FemAB family PEP-CTERM system-associated protein [Planctomycetaceae bacterium]
MTLAMGQRFDVRDCGVEDSSAWEAYVRSHQGGTLFHLPQWSRAVVRAYGHRPYHLAAWDGPRIVGLLPMFLVKSLFVGRVLISIPYATYGGILADSQPISQALLEAAQELHRRLSTRYIELRHRDSSGLDLPVTDRYDTFRKELASTSEGIMAQLPQKARTAARKGFKLLGEDCVSIGPNNLDTVYDIYSRRLRQLGSPSYRRAFFHALQEEFGDDCACVLVRGQGEVLAGLMGFFFRDEFTSYFAGNVPHAFTACATGAMYLRTMQYVVDRGGRIFDLNRSRRDNSGPYQWKRHQGFEPEPLHYQTYNAGGGELPNLTPSNRKFLLASRAWRRMPLWFTRAVGGRVTKWIP